MTGSDQGDGDGYVGLTPGSGWEQPGDSPIPRTFFLQSFKIRVPKYSIPLWVKRAAIVVGVLILCDAAWLIWPYYSLHKLTEAFRSGDIVALEKGVAWDSVRQGLRRDFNAVPEAAALTPGILEQALARYVDPQAIAVDGSNQNKTVQRGRDSALAGISQIHPHCWRCTVAPDSKHLFYWTLYLSSRSPDSVRRQSEKPLHVDFQLVMGMEAYSNHSSQRWITSRRKFEHIYGRGQRLCFTRTCPPKKEAGLPEEPTNL